MEMNKAKAKPILDLFYIYLADENYDDLMGLINPVFSKAFGEEDALKQHIQSHRKLMGQNKSYTVTSQDAGELMTVFETEVVYNDTTEKQTVTIAIDKDNNATISELDFERPPYVDRMAEDFFTAYRLGDFQTIYNYLHPRFYEYTTAEELSNALIQLEEKAGEFRGYMLKEEVFYCVESTTLPTTIYTGIYIVSFEKISIYVEIELCEESNMIGINFIGLDFIEE